MGFYCINKKKEKKIIRRKTEPDFSSVMCEIFMQSCVLNFFILHRFKKLFFKNLGKFQIHLGMGRSTEKY